MATQVKPNLADPLDLVKSQGSTSVDVLAWMKQAVNERRAENEIFDALDPASTAARLSRQKMTFWSAAVDRLFEQYELMTRG